MSFILDALRKSEHARERRALPGFGDVPAARAAPSRLPWILGGVGLLLLVNIAVLLYVLVRPSPPAAAPRSPAAAALPPGTGTARVAPAAAPATAVPARQGVPKVRPLAAETEPAAPALDYPEPPRAPARAAAEPYAAERAAAAREFRPGVAAGLPTIHELPAQATAGLPVLNIDLHVFSSDPKQRFVIINGQRLHEGAQLREGPTVERITADGAILNHQGTRFLLPRE